LEEERKDRLCPSISEIQQVDTSVIKSYGIYDIINKYKITRNNPLSAGHKDPAGLG